MPVTLGAKRRRTLPCYSDGAVAVKPSLVFRMDFSVEVEPVGVVDELIEDGVGEGRFADVVMPGFDRELAGDYVESSVKFPGLFSAVLDA